MQCSFAGDDSFSGLESLTLIALSCNPKLSPAGQLTAKHDGLYPLLSVSLTVPPFVESRTYNFFLAFKHRCQSAIVGSCWANSCPGCVDRLRKRYCHLVGGDMHVGAARLGCQSAMVESWWANSCPGCVDRLRKRYSHLVGVLFLSGKAAWDLSG